MQPAYDLRHGRGSRICRIPVAGSAGARRSEKHHHKIINQAKNISGLISACVDKAMVTVSYCADSSFWLVCETHFMSGLLLLYVKCTRYQPLDMNVTLNLLAIHEPYKQTGALWIYRVSDVTFDLRNLSWKKIKHTIRMRISKDVRFWIIMNGI